MTKMLINKNIDCETRTSTFVKTRIKYYWNKCHSHRLGVLSRIT